MFLWLKVWCLIFGFGVLINVGCAMTIQQMNKAAMGFRNACVSKVGADKELVEGLRHGQFPEDEQLKCYTKCIMNRLKTFQNGQINIDMLIRQINMMAATEIVPMMVASAQACASESKGDSCDTTYNYVKCVYNADPRYFFFP